MKIDKMSYLSTQAHFTLKMSRSDSDNQPAPPTP